MRHAARQPRDDPAPEREDLDAKAAQVLGGMAGLVTRAQALMARCPDPQTVPLVRQFIVETISTALHVEELRGELARYAEACEGYDHIFEQGRAFERAQAAKAAVPGPRHRRSSASRRPGEGQVALFAVKLQGIALVAFGALKPLLPHLKHAGTAVKGAAHAHRMVTAALTALTVPAAAAAVYVVAPAVMHHAPAAAAVPSASVPGWRTSAVPIPSSMPVFPAVVHPKAKHAAKGKTLSALGLPVPSYSGPGQSFSSVPSSPSPPASSAPSGPATLDLGGVTSLTLTSAVPQATVTLTASGSGWVSWKVTTTGGDLDFSPSHGVLQAGQSVTVTVSLDASQDGLGQQGFSIGGQSVMVSLPLPVQVPVVLPTGAASPVVSAVPSL